jgi:ABC-type Na+ efflux pump permease subunit
MMAPSPPRAAAAIAWHEVRRLVGAFRRPSTALGLAGAVILLAMLWPVVLERGLAPDRGLYPVSVEPGAPLAPVVASDPRFAVVPGGFEAGAVLEVRADGPHAQPTDAGRAALRELQDALRHWQEERLRDEADGEAAFPVQVNVVMATPRPARPLPPPANASAGPPSLLDETAPEAASVQTDLSPSEVEPPFPVRSLLLTFTFLIPMNFVAQLHAGSLLADRVRDRALLALTTPHAPRTVLLGRSLPYLAAAAAVWLVGATVTGAGWQGWAAMAPVVLFVLAVSTLLGLLARSERELTFLLTGSTTMLSIFLFLPAVFTAVPAVALLSPVSVLVSSMQGDAVAAGPFLYATLPLSLATVALGLLGAALYREETLFSVQPLRAKVLAALARRTRRAWSTVVAGVLTVPFAFTLELLVLALAIPVGVAGMVPLVVVIFLGVALIEERLKLAVAAARRRAGKSALAGAAWAGLGFFLGEKLALLLALVGFGDLTLGPETLRVFGVSANAAIALLPLALHVACSMLAASGLGRRRPVPALAYLGAVALHFAYNLAAVYALGVLE